MNNPNLLLPNLESRNQERASFMDSPGADRPRVRLVQVPPRAHRVDRPEAAGSARRGFTLIELLTVVAIIAILAVLAFGGFGAIRGKSQVAKSLQELRQVGLAIQHYANDNDTTLPGPLFTSIQPRIRNSDTGQLATRIAPYLGYTVTNQWQTCKEMIFATWKPLIPAYNPSAGGLSTLMCNWNDYDRKTVPSRPFGYPGTDSWSSAPLRLVQIPELEKFWLVCEQMLTVPGKAPTNPTGGKRMFLFASGRVGLEEPGYFSYTK